MDGGNAKKERSIRCVGSNGLQSTLSRPIRLIMLTEGMRPLRIWDIAFTVDAATESAFTERSCLEGIVPAEDFKDLVVSGGKDGMFYLLHRSSLGHGAASGANGG